MVKKENFAGKKEKSQEDASKLGQILLKAKLISREQLDDALKESKKKRKPLGEVLVQKKVISETITTVGTKYFDILSAIF